MRSIGRVRLYLASTSPARLATLRARLERLPTATPEEENALRRPRTPSYSVHLEWADSLGVPPLSSEPELSARLADGRLVPLEALALEERLLHRIRGVAHI